MFKVKFKFLVVFRYICTISDCTLPILGVLHSKLSLVFRYMMSSRWKIFANWKGVAALYSGTLFVNGTPRDTFLNMKVSVVLMPLTNKVEYRNHPVPLSRWFVCLNVCLSVSYPLHTNSSNSSLKTIKGDN